MQSVQELRKHSLPFKYSQDRDTLRKFILFFQENDQFKYLIALRNKDGLIRIDLNDLSLYDDTGIAARFERNAFSYLRLLENVIDEILFDDGDGTNLLENNLLENNINGNNILENNIQTGNNINNLLENIIQTENIINNQTGNNLKQNHNQDIFLLQRVARLKEISPDRKITEIFPGPLLRNYTLSLIPLRGPCRGIREVGARDVGALVRMRGIVTRVGQVKPAVRVVTYVCESCGTEVYQTVENETFEALEECFSEKCRTRRVRGTLCLVTRGSRFIRGQCIHLQELTGDVPHGCVPKLVRVEVYGNLTERMRPGESVIIGGVFLPRAYYGFKRLKAGLLNDVYLYCTDVVTDGCNLLNNINGNLFNTVNNVDMLIASFAPEIYGLTEVKKILLLLLVGSPPVIRPDGLRIRGDINALLVGDPGIAKSQLLKTVARVARRGVYTTGRGSSGVGLTAAITKDLATGEAVLEGGALVLSDRGVCCIDELDKMNELDRVAIHEVMEQQSVSIAKAGINTTLNARCAVLAAANPTRGRYDPRKPVEQNVGLPVSLLSRFDVLCILRDDPDQATDLALATHVTALHFEEPGAPVDYAGIRVYLDACRAVNPVLTDGVRERLLDAYSKARRNPSITPRHLLALIRLTLAHARLRGAEKATEDDASEAVHLLEFMRVPTPQGKSVSRRKEIFDFLMGQAVLVGDQKTIDLREIYTESVSYKKEDIEKVIEEFKKSGIWLEEDGKLIITN